MTPRPDMVAPEAPDGVEVLQLTQGSRPACHLYMEAQVFAPDSSWLLVHESATAHGGHKDDPEHQYFLCDLANAGALHPVTEETGVTAASVTPDGQWIYYFVNETKPAGGRLTLKRVKPDGSDRATVFVLDTPLPGTTRYASRPYPLSTVRADGKKLALSCFLGDGCNVNEPWGLMVFDLDRPDVELILQGASWCNVHPQYSRSLQAEHRHDILVQENHDNLSEPDGTIKRLVGGMGADIHVIRDDGSDFRDMPWGRDGNEFCQGHQCWRGTTDWAITSTGTKEPAEAQLIESRPTPPAGHLGTASPGGVRNHLSRDFPGPCFSHFATDRAGTRLITDTSAADKGGRVFVAALHAAGDEAATAWTCLAHPRSSWQKESHIHPFLSPDGAMGFFNSDESGVLQAYMIRNVRS